MEVNIMTFTTNQKKIINAVKNFKTGFYNETLNPVEKSIKKEDLSPLDIASLRYLAISFIKENGMYLHTAFGFEHEYVDLYAVDDSLMKQGNTIYYNNTDGYVFDAGTDAVCIREVYMNTSNRIMVSIYLMDEDFNMSDEYVDFILL